MLTPIQQTNSLSSLLHGHGYPLSKHEFLGLPFPDKAQIHQRCSSWPVLGALPGSKDHLHPTGQVSSEEKGQPFLNCPTPSTLCSFQRDGLTQPDHFTAGNNLPLGFLQEHSEEQSLNRPYPSGCTGHIPLPQKLTQCVYVVNDKL